MVGPEIKAITQKLVNALTDRGIRVEKVILYGSYASGNMHDDSDIDIAIISPDFGEDKYEERKMLLQIAWKIDLRLEPLPVSTTSFQQDTWIPLIHEIRQKGVELTY